MSLMKTLLPCRQVSIFSVDLRVTGEPFPVYRCHFSGSERSRYKGKQPVLQMQGLGCEATSSWDDMTGGFLTVGLRTIIPST